MTRHLPVLFLLGALVMPGLSSAQGVAVDTSGVRPGPVSVTTDREAVTVSWPDESSRTWRAVFSLNPKQPLITSIATGSVAVLTEARAFYRGETGKRRQAAGMYFRRSDEPSGRTRHVQATFEPAAKARTIMIA
jgi:hypothetical protein